MAPLRVDVADVVKEYRFRSLFHCSRDEFLGTPVWDVEKLLAVHDVLNRGG